MGSLLDYLKFIVMCDEIQKMPSIHDELVIEDKMVKGIVKSLATNTLFDRKGQIKHEKLREVREHDLVENVIVDMAIPDRSFIAIEKGRIYFSRPVAE